MNILTKNTFLTVRWNNILSFGLGIPGFIFVVYAFSTSVWTGSAGMIGLSIFGALF